MRTLEELQAAGLRGKALSDAAYEERFGHPPFQEPLTPEQRELSWQRFLAVMAEMTPEELNDGFMDHRKSVMDVRHSDPEADAA